MRPAVGDDVVHGQQQHVLVSAEPQQRRAEQRAAREVEAGAAPPPRIAAALAPRAPSRARPPDVVDRQIEVGRPRAMTCTRLARPPATKRGAQHLVPAHDLARARAASAPRSSGPVSRSADGMLYERARPARAGPGTTAAAARTRAAAAPSRGTRPRGGAARRAGAARARCAAARPRDGRAPRRARAAAARRRSAARTRAITWVASSEWPPSSKKSSSTPTALDAQHLGPDAAHSSSSTGVRGAT